MTSFCQDFGSYDDNLGAYTIEVWKKSLIVSILSAGNFLGAIGAGPTADRLGRRWAIIVTSIVFAVGVAFQTFATNWELMVVGRFIAGVGVGLISDLVPLYLAEAAPKHLRGALVSCYQLAITIGILIAFVVNGLTKALEGRSAYAIPIGLQFLYALIMGGGRLYIIPGMYFLPDSPRVLVKRGQNEAAVEALCRLWGTNPNDERIIEEMKEMQESNEREKSFGDVGYGDLFKGTVTQRTHLTVWLQMFQQLTGINFIFYFGYLIANNSVTFFKVAGFKEPYVIQIITGLVNVFAVIPGIYFVDRIGRRSLLLSGSIIMLSGHLVVGIIGTVWPESVEAGYVLVVAVCVFIFGFEYSWGPGAWVWIL